MSVGEASRLSMPPALLDRNCLLFEQDAEPSRTRQTDGLNIQRSAPNWCSEESAGRLSSLITEASAKLDWLTGAILCWLSVGRAGALSVAQYCAARIPGLVRCACQVARGARWAGVGRV